MYGKYYTSANLCKHGTEHDLHLINSILKMIKPISRKKKKHSFCRYATAYSHSSGALQSLQKQFLSFFFLHLVWFLY